MKILKCYQIFISDGGGGSKHGFYVMSKEAAEQWTAKNTWDFFYEKEITIFDDLEDYETNSAEALKRNALAKLTEQEKELLGLK